MATTISSAEETRAERAKEETMTLTGCEGDMFAISGDSGNVHVVETSGSTAKWCSCPDHQNRKVRCKHMAAYENWEFDVLDLD